MKTIVTSLLSVLFLSGEIHAQDSKATHLYWVVETNIHYRDYTIVRFYNSEDVKVHEVKLMGVFIDIRNVKHRRKLDQLKEHFERAKAFSKRINSTRAI